MYALIAAVPILLTIVFMVFMNWSAKRSLIISWLAAFAVACSVWGMGIGEAAARTVAGFLASFETSAIIFGAILLMNVATPLIDKYTMPKPFGEVKQHA